ncbi:hypothetical [Yersinia pestis KIM10+]|uniref:Uncharacterized protein n=1 Tax=Yersinia pestis TaxID=632 RepID=Q8CL73_YERPE|nr:hypothetical [Yersinia pestis KIM10+]
MGIKTCGFYINYYWVIPTKTATQGVKVTFVCHQFLIFIEFSVHYVKFSRGMQGVNCDK